MITLWLAHRPLLLAASILLLLSGEERGWGKESRDPNRLSFLVGLVFSECRGDVSIFSPVEETPSLMSSRGLEGEGVCLSKVPLPLLPTETEYDLLGATNNFGKEPSRDCGLSNELASQWKSPSRERSRTVAMALSGLGECERGRVWEEPEVKLCLCTRMTGLPSTGELLPLSLFSRISKAGPSNRSKELSVDSVTWLPDFASMLCILRSGVPGLFLTAACCFRRSSSVLKMSVFRLFRRSASRVLSALRPS